MHGVARGFADHSWLSKTRGRLPHEVHERVFGWVLALIAERGLVRGERISVDASTMEANAALRAIVRRDTGEGYRAMLARMAQESGIETPTAEDLIRMDRNRTGKRLSNEEWVSETDPEARIARMQDGTTHLAYKPEHAIDLDTGAVVAAEMHPADHGATTTIASRSVQGRLFAAWIAHQHPADRHLHAGVMPERGAGGDVDAAFGAAIPAIDPDPMPGCGGIGQPVQQARQASAFDPPSPECARLARGSGLIQTGVEPQPRDHAQVPTHVAQEFDRGKAAVPHRDDAPSWQPSYRLQQPLPSPVGQLLMPLATLPGVALGGREHGQERQSPDATSPGHWGEQHHTQPAQAAGLDEVAVAGANQRLASRPRTGGGG